MLNKYFDRLSNKGLVKKTKHVLCVGTSGNTIYKCMKKGIKKIILAELEKQGFNNEYNKDNRVTIIYYQGNFVGVLQ